MVGLYIYAAAHTTGTYDWTMAQVLPAVFTSLKLRGWNQAKEPLVGIPQAFGGLVDGEPWPTPSASNIETQAKTYCQQGATGILYYDWTEAGPSPMTNAQIALGVQRGVSDCESIWK
jgi:hypothetical protein